MEGVPFLGVEARHLFISEEIKAVLNRVVDSGIYVLGPEVRAFEEKFADYTGTGHSICVNSGTSALHLALLAAGVSEGDEVIVPAMTFIATAMAVTYIGAKPVCVDVDQFCTMNPEAIQSSITPKTKAIVPVHLYGQPADMDAIIKIAEKNALVVVEDAAQAHGAVYKNRRCGSLATAAAWSFYPGKNLGALGEGGAITTNDSEIAEKCAMLREWGQRSKGQHVVKGFNYRMDNLQGAALGVKLGYLEEWTEMRIAAARMYHEKLRGIRGIEIPEVRTDARCVWHVFATMVENRERVAAQMRERKIEVGIHYPCAIHLHPCYRDLGYRRGDFPVAEKIADNELSLPMFPGITEAQIEKVTHTLSEAVG